MKSISTDSKNIKWHLLELIKVCEALAPTIRTGGALVCTKVRPPKMDP